jgi:DUF971 family protein
MSDLHPVALRKAGPAALAIDWSDGHKSIVRFATLRAKCPCASCREDRRNAAGGHSDPASAHAAADGHAHEHGHEHGAAHDHGRGPAGPTPAIPLPLAGPASAPAGPPVLKEVNPVGRYAYSLVWSDGHASGIYAFEYLRTLCECEACGGASAAL